MNVFLLEGLESSCSEIPNEAESTKRDSELHDSQSYDARGAVVIVVTPAYRLNVFGFFTTLDGMAPGNSGLLDQVAALDWVQQQIRDFGGNPDKVVIGGHGAGAVSVGLHLVSPLSQGKFSAALQMSGGPLMTSAIKSHQRGIVADIGDNFGCDELLICLRKISPLILLIQTGTAADWGPVVDGLYVNNTAEAFLPAHPLVLFMEQRFTKVPLMAGYTDMEDALEFSKHDSPDSNDFDKESFNTLIGDSALDGVSEPEDNETCYLDKTFIRDSVSFFYNSDPNNLDDVLLKQKYMYYMTEKKYGASIFNQSFYMSNFKQIFLYRFDYRLKTMGVLDLQDWMTSPQFGEIPFVFGMPYWTSVSSPIIWNSADKKVADSVMGFWGNFTKSFNPAQHGRNIKWEPYNPDMPSVMILDKVFNMSDPATINYKALTFWNEYFPKVVRIATQCCNMTNQSYKIDRTLTYRLFSVYTFYTLLAIFL
ncbi:Carboxylesterase [Homalodisca vitripennis]|nr:Carboxylesterase [Homalodisca vitripennis]